MATPSTSPPPSPKRSDPTTPRRHSSRTRLPNPCARALNLRRHVALTSLVIPTRHRHWQLWTKLGAPDPEGLAHSQSRVGAKATRSDTLRPRSGHALVARCEAHHEVVAAASGTHAAQRILQTPLSRQRQRMPSVPKGRACGATGEARPHRPSGTRGSRLPTLSLPPSSRALKGRQNQSRGDSDPTFAPSGAREHSTTSHGFRPTHLTPEGPTGRHSQSPGPASAAGTSVALDTHPPAQRFLGGAGRRPRLYGGAREQARISSRSA